MVNIINYHPWDAPPEAPAQRIKQVHFGRWEFSRWVGAPDVPNPSFWSLL